MYRNKTIDRFLKRVSEKMAAREYGKEFNDYLQELITNASHFIGGLPTEPHPTFSQRLRAEFYGAVAWLLPGDYRDHGRKVVIERLSRQHKDKI